MENRDYRIDLLKGIAMIMVVLLHSIQMIDGLHTVIRFPVLFGQVGVQLFFLSSGFLVMKTYLIKNKKITFKSHFSYIVRKYVSLAIPFILFLIIYFIVNVFFVKLGVRVPYKNNTSIISVLINIFLLHGLFPFCQNNVVPGAWYIGTLVLLIYISPLFKFKRKNYLIKVLPLAIALIMSVIAVILSRYNFSVDNGSFFYFSFLNQLPAFVVGVQLATDEEEKTFLWLVIRAIVCFTCVLVLFVFELSFSYALIPVLAAYGFREVYYFLGKFNNKNKSMIIKIFSYIGENTYPIYLAHFLFVWYIPVLLKHYINLNGILLWITALFLGALLCVLSGKINLALNILTKTAIRKLNIKK